MWRPSRVSTRGNGPPTKLYSTPVLQIAAHVLRALKKNAEEYLQQPVEHAVVTVPAYFNDRCACYSARLTLSSQRQATRDAGELAGLQVLRVVNEPTAAALASGIGLNSDDRNIAVYDLGGGTFDVSVLTCGEGFFQVRATNGDTFLGGEDFDTALFEYVFDAGLVDRAELLDDSTTLERLKDLLQQARIDLDSESQVTVSLPFMLRGKDSDTPRSHSFVLTREALDSISKPLVDRTLVPCGNSLRDADMSPEDIHEVVLVGGVSQMPLVRDAVTKMFGCEPKSSINPMHAVGLGAALQAGVLAGKVDDLILVDVTPLSLGIETLDGLFSVLIPRNTKVPTSLTESFSTGVDGQTTVQINVLQGERPLAADNHKLGEFLLTDIPPQAQGKPQIDVTFDINSDGIVRVSAKDKATEKEQRILIEPSSGLTRSHIEAVLEDAKSEKKEDRARVARAQEVANAQAVLRDVEDNLAKFASQLEKEVPEEKAKLEELLSAAWNIVESADQPLKGAMAVQKAAVETFRKAARSTS